MRERGSERGEGGRERESERGKRETEREGERETREGKGRKGIVCCVWHGVKVVVNSIVPVASRPLLRYERG